MTSRWLTRALVAVPTLAAVAKIYPHLDGGSADITRQSKIRMPSKTCKNGEVIKGATSRDAFYAPKMESVEDLTATGANGSR
jgi:hypothetical protein